MDCGPYLKKCRLDGDVTSVGYQNGHIVICSYILTVKKGEGLPQQDDVAQGVPDRLRPRIILTFGTTRVAGR
jgi:hypothetical protein